MTSPRILAVGGEESFVGDVADALGVEPAELEWAPTTQEADRFVARSSPLYAVVVAPDVSNDDALDIACSVVAGSPATAVIVTRRSSANGFLPAAMRIGVREVVNLSKGTDELKNALESAMAWSSTLWRVQDDGSHKPQVHTGTTISVFASKGGTGKTFLASNLAAALATRSRRDTALVDLDVDLGDVFSYFGTEPKGSIHDAIVAGPHASKRELIAAGTELIPHLWAFGAPNDLATTNPISADMVTSLLAAMRSTFAYTVIDATAEYSDVALAAFDASDAICLVTGLDVVGIKHLAKALETLETIGLPRDKCRIVLNRADSKVGLEAGDVERVLNIKVDAAIPSSRAVPMSLNKGVPIYVDDPLSEVSRSIGALADRFIGSPDKVESAPRRRGFPWRSR